MISSIIPIEYKMNKLSVASIIIIIINNIAACKIENNPPINKSFKFFIEKSIYKYSENNSKEIKYYLNIL